MKVYHNCSRDVDVNIEDPFQILDARRLAHLCQEARLPRPDRVKASPMRSRFVEYGLRLPTTDGHRVAVLRLDLVPTPRGFGIDHVFAARALLAENGEIPTRGDIRRVSKNLFGVPGALMGAPPWTDGLRLGAMRAGYWTEVARDVGQMIARLADTRTPSFGLLVKDGQFVAQQDTWREEWELLVNRAVGAAQRTGVDLGPLSARLHTFIQERMDALDGVKEFSMVHGELKANALKYRLVDGSAQVVAVDHWDMALCGDPLVEVGFLLTMPPTVLEQVLTGVGADRVQSWLEPAAIARIEVYHASLFLRRIHDVAVQNTRTRNPGTLDALEVLRLYASQALVPDFARDRLQAALQTSEAPSQADGGIQASPHKITARQALLHLRGEPPLAVSQGPSCILSLATANLANRLADQPNYIGKLPDLARRLIASQRRVAVCVHTVPIADRTQWAADLTQRLLKSSEADAVGYNRWLLWWVGLDALNALDWTVSDAVLRGLEALVIAIDEAPEPEEVPMVERLAAAAAFTSLAEGSDEDTRGRLLALRDGCVAALTQEIDSAGEQPPTTDFPLPALLPMLADADPTFDALIIRPLIALSLMTLSGEVALPADATTLIRLVGG